MKLILSSYDFLKVESKNLITEHLTKPLNECRILFIPDETATSEIIESDFYYKNLCEYGFKRENIFIFNHTKAQKFTNLPIDVIYVGGGNTFGIIDKIRKCNFDTAIINYVKAGVVYIGVSAGAHIVTQNIEHILEYDDNNVNLTDFSGLGLYDGIIVCHYTYHRKDHLDRLIAEKKYKVDYLTDSDCIVHTDKETFTYQWW